MSENQLATVTLMRFKGSKARWKAFVLMGKSPQALKDIPEMVLGKMMGSGSREGFGIWPDFGVYALLNIWKNREAASDFFSHHPFWNALKSISFEYYTIYLKPIQVKGLWDGICPFVVDSTRQNNIPLTAVLTRATIKFQYLARFWSFVPAASRAIRNRPGLILAIGIGEWPIFQQATFSIWETPESIDQYAYKSVEHKKVIKRTRATGWYQEELFARFIPFDSQGTWNGENLLKNYLNPK